MGPLFTHNQENNLHLYEVRKAPDDRDTPSKARGESVMTPTIGKYYRYIKQPLSPAYKVEAFFNGNALCIPTGCEEVCAVFTPKMFEDLIPANEIPANEREDDR